MNYLTKFAICKMKKYQYKESGVEWFGEIPVNWQCSRLKNISNIVGRIGFRGYKTSDLVNEGEGAIALSPSNIIDNRMSYDKCKYLSWFKYEESPEIKVYNEDIIFVKTGSSFGKVSYVSELPEKATLNPQLVVFKNLRCNSKYLFYLIHSDIVKNQVNTYILGGTIPTLSQSKLGRCEIPLPPLQEQKVIAEYLDQATEKIDKVIAIKGEQLKKMAEYYTNAISVMLTKGVKRGDLKGTNCYWMPEINKNWKIQPLKLGFR